MTDHEPRPDAAARRRAQHFRTILGVDRVPARVGTELLTVSADVSAQARVRLAAGLRSYAKPPRHDQQRLLADLADAIDEFAHILEGRPLAEPSVGARLIEHACDAADPPRFLLAMDRGLDAMRAGLRDLWPTLTHAAAHAARLDLAFNRYADELAGRAMVTVCPPGLAGDRSRTEQARLKAVFALIERRGQDRPVPLYIALGPRLDTDPPPTWRPAPAAPGGSGIPASFYAASDHVLLVTPEPPVRAGGALRPPGTQGRSAPLFTLWGGPVSPAEAAAAYEIELTMLRLVRAGAAAAPHRLLRLPDLGFLSVRPTEDAIAQIVAALGPLAEETAYRRFMLARTLQLQLRTGGSAQAIAGCLGVHSQSTRNHLHALHRVYGSHDLDFGRDPLALRAALDLVLPLWEQEAQTSP